MTIELGALNIPIRATGRDAVLQAFAEIDRAGAKVGGPVAIPISTPGATEAIAQLAAVDRASAGLASRVQTYHDAITSGAGPAAALQAALAGSLDQSASAALNGAKGFRDLSAAYAAAAPAAEANAAATAQAAQATTQEAAAADVARQAIQRLNREVGSSGTYGAGLDKIRERITLLTKGTQLEGTRADSLRKLEGAEGALQTALQNANLTLRERITLAEQLARVQAALATSTIAQVRPVSAVAAGMARGNSSSLAWAAGLANVQAQQAGVGATGALAQAGLRRMTSGLQQLAVVALGTRSAVGQLATGALLSFGASAALTLGVVAGIAAIAYAWDKLTESARKSEEQLKKTREELEKATPRQLAAESVAIIQAAITRSEAALQRLEQGDRSIGLPAAPAKDIAKPKADLDLLRRDLVKAQAEAGKLDQQGTDESIAALTKAIELRTASTFQIRQALALLPQLRARAADETQTLLARNAAQTQANALQAAFDKLAKESAEARQAAIDALRDEVAVLTETAGQRALTTQETDRLRDAYVRITAALDNKNNTDRQQLELLKAQRQALAELAQQTSATFTTEGSTFGQAFGLGQPKTPALDQITFGSPALDRPNEFFGAGALDKLTTDLDRQAAQAGNRVKGAIAGVQDQIDASLDQLRTSIAQGLTDALVNGIASGFEEGIASGSIGKGAAALTAGLLSGLGSAAISFGVGSLGIAKLMVVIKKALESLNPAAAIPAAIGLIGLGGLLKGVASRMFGGSSGSGGASSGGSVASRDQTVRIVVGRDGEIVRRLPSAASASVSATPTAARAAGRMEPAPTFVYAPTIFGVDNATAQRHMYEMLSLGAQRGLKIKTGRG